MKNSRDRKHILNTKKINFLFSASFLIFWLIRLCCCQQSVSTCNDLQHMQVNNVSASYKLQNSIDCSNFTFTPVGNSSLTFKGTLNGQNYTIGNLTIASSSNYLALFGYGIGAKVTNLIFENINITGNASSSNVGVLFGECDSCNISNIVLTTSSPSFTNCIKGYCSVGGICGILRSYSSLTNSTVQNTFVSGFRNIGGIAGSVCSYSSVKNCYNLGFQSSSSLKIIEGCFVSGGILGFCQMCSITKCGTHQGVVSPNPNSGNPTVGGVVGDAICSPLFSELYSLQNVFVNCSYREACGGIVGAFRAQNSSISNIYSKASIQGGLCIGGLIGTLTFCANTSLNISFSYASVFLSTTNMYIGNIIGNINSQYYNLTIYNVYYLNNSFPAIGNGNSTDGTSSIGFNCSFLYTTIVNTFNEMNIWGGDALKSQFNYSYSNSSCSTTLIPTSNFATSNFPTTIVPTTNVPTSNFPTTNVPSSLTPTTNIPTTNIPSSLIPITNLPTSQVPTSFIPSIYSASVISSTNLPTFQTNPSSTLISTSSIPTSSFPTTQILTTNVQTTQVSTTNSPLTNIPSTNVPSSLISSQFLVSTQSSLNSLTPSSQIQTTNEPSTYTATIQASTSFSVSTNYPTSPITHSNSILPTIFPTNFTVNCFYQVLNCQFCSLNPIQVDITQFNISCSLIGGIYIWIFKNSTSNTIYNNFTITLNGSINFIEGNFTQTSSGKLVFVLNTNQNSSSFPSLNVSGCVSINGTISLVLNTQPQQGTSSFQIISYNCSQQANISSNQIQISSSYKNNECDQTSSQVINSPNSISVSLSSSLGSKCGGPNLGLIIGLAVGIPILALIILFSLILFKYKQKEQFSKQMGALDNQMKNFK